MRLLQSSAGFLLILCAVYKEWNVWLKKGIQRKWQSPEGRCVKKGLQGTPNSELTAPSGLQRAICKCWLSIFGVWIWEVSLCERCQLPDVQRTESLCFKKDGGWCYTPIWLWVLFRTTLIQRAAILHSVVFPGEQDKNSQLLRQHTILKK